MLERVIQAILLEARENGADSPVDYGDAEQLARAAIKAMREFSPEMEEAAMNAVPLLEGKEARWSWEAIIDSAVKR